MSCGDQPTFLQQLAEYLSMNNLTISGGPCSKTTEYMPVQDDKEFHVWEEVNKRELAEPYITILTERMRVNRGYLYRTTSYVNGTDLNRPRTEALAFVPDPK